MLRDHGRETWLEVGKIMIVVRPPTGSFILPPGLIEESFDADTRLGRVNLLAILYNVLVTINREKGETADLILILSGPVTYWYRPGGGIPWEEIHELFIHPLNFRNTSLRDGGGSLSLTRPLMNALVKELEQSGFTISAGPSSVTVEELGGTRIRLYNPVEIGFSGSLWDVFDPGTSIYIGPPESLKWLQGLIAFLPDKRTILAGQFINQAKGHSESGDLRNACRDLAGAAQVLGRIRLRSDIAKSCEGTRTGARSFTRFLEEVETASATIDALWRYHAGEHEIRTLAFPLEPVSVSLKEPEAPLFASLCQELGIICIAEKRGDGVTISLDKRELERSAGKLGTRRLTRFSLFFEEVPGPAIQEEERNQLIRIPGTGGKVKYYHLKKG